MESSYIMTKGRAIEAFPMLKSDGLVGALVYYDGKKCIHFPCLDCSSHFTSFSPGQHNDARMNVSLIMTAVQHGATVVNHTEVVGLHKKAANGKLCGARVKDRFTGEEFDVRAKVNCLTGLRFFTYPRESFSSYYDIQ